MSEILRKAILFFLLCSSVGWLFLGASIQSRRDRRKKIESERARATGTIVDYVPQKRGQPHPVVEFTAYGRVNRLECPVELDPGELPVGAQVEVLHHPDDPSRFHLEQYDYIVVNDKIEQCIEDTHAIIEAAHCKPFRNERFIQTVREDLYRLKTETN
jgi:hypothetical protein